MQTAAEIRSTIVRCLSRSNSVDLVTEEMETVRLLAGTFSICPRSEKVIGKTTVDGEDLELCLANLMSSKEISRFATS